MLRYIPIAILAIGFPAFFWFALTTMSPLLYIYSVFAYAGIIILAAEWATGLLFQSSPEEE